MFQYKGTFVFKENGKELGRSENVMTDNGRKVILQYLCGLRQDWASSIAIGAFNTAASTSDLELNFETAKIPVTLKTFQSATGSSPDLIVLRGTLPSNMYANIYEIGVYPDDLSNAYLRNNAVVTDFSNLTNWTTDSGSTFIVSFIPGQDSSPRIGGYSVQLLPSTSFYNNTYSFSLNSYSDVDTLNALVYNTGAGNLNVRLTDVSGNYADFNYTLVDNAGYSVLSAPFPSVVYSSTGTPITTGMAGMGNITTIRFTTDSTATVTIDTLKTSTSMELTSTDYLISRSVLSTPIAKNYGTTLDIEYYVQLL